MEEKDRTVNTDQIRLSRMLKRFWLSVIAAPIIWTLGCMIILVPFGNGQNLSGVLVFLGYFVILAAALLTAFGIAMFVLIKRKSLMREQIILGLLPMLLFFLAGVFLVLSSV